MSEWSWVVLGYAITYAAVIGYWLTLSLRRAAVRRSRMASR